MSVEGQPPADGENTTRGNSAVLTPLAPEQGEHLGRSPDSRVNAWPNLPITELRQWHIRLRSPPTVAGAVVD